MGEMKDDGGPAFPVHGGYGEHDDPRNRISGGGLTKREWFAGKWLEGRVASGLGTPIETLKSGETHPQWLARNAFLVADAMIAASKQEAKNG